MWITASNVQTALCIVCELCDKPYSLEEESSEMNHLPVGIQLLRTAAGIRGTINWHYITLPKLAVSVEVVGRCECCFCVRWFTCICATLWLLQGRSPRDAAATNSTAEIKDQRLKQCVRRNMSECQKDKTGEEQTVNKRYENESMKEREKIERIKEKVSKWKRQIE